MLDRLGGRVDKRFQVGDQLMLDAADQGAAECGRDRQAPATLIVGSALPSQFKVKFPVATLQVAGPNTYTVTLALPKRFQCIPTVNVDRLQGLTETPTTSAWTGLTLRDRSQAAASRWDHKLISTWWSSSTARSIEGNLKPTTCTWCGGKGVPRGNQWRT